MKMANGKFPLIVMVYLAKHYNQYISVTDTKESVRTIQYHRMN